MTQSEAYQILDDLEQGYSQFFDIDSLVSFLSFFARTKKNFSVKFLGYDVRGDVEITIISN